VPSSSATATAPVTAPAAAAPRRVRAVLGALRSSRRPEAV
jgi:hypothetical protein